jgi:hypothetical protein
MAVITLTDLAQVIFFVFRYGIFNYAAVDFVQASFIPYAANSLVFLPVHVSKQT